MLSGQNTQRRAHSTFTYLTDTLENISKNQQNNSDGDAGVDSEQRQRLRAAMVLLLLLLLLLRTRMSEIRFHASKQSGRTRAAEQRRRS